jgi:hypothetical protein
MSIAEEADVATLRAALVKHRKKLTVALNEISALKSSLRNLERIVEEQQAEKKDFLENIERHRLSDATLKREIASLNEKIAALEEQKRRESVSHADYVTSLENARREEIMALKETTNRLSAQIAACTNSAARGLPWNRVAELEHHPIHTIRRVIVADEKRELLLQARGPSTLPLEEEVEDSALDVLLTESECEEVSHDEEQWRAVGKRVHKVLEDRRRMLFQLKTEMPIDFLLRTRHQMVGEWVFVHRELRRAMKHISRLYQRCDAVVCGSTFDAQKMFVELQRELEIALSVMEDLDCCCIRVKKHSFSTVDRIIHEVPE